MHYKRIEEFKNCTKNMDMTKKLYYAISYFSDCNDIFELLCYIANENPDEIKAKFQR